ncbi:hypothetical protein Tco_0786156 [Tanacetum coccineum]
MSSMKLTCVSCSCSTLFFTAPKVLRGRIIGGLSSSMDTSEEKKNRSANKVGSIPLPLDVSVKSPSDLAAEKMLGESGNILHPENTSKDSIKGTKATSIREGQLVSSTPN